MTDPLSPVPIVQCAFTAANSIRLAATHWHDVKAAGHQALVAARKAGDALLRAKAECPHGEWLALLERTWPGSYAKATRCMRIASNWAEVEAAETPAEALRLLVEDADQSFHSENFDATVQTDADAEPATTSGETATKPVQPNSGGAGKPTAQGTLFSGSAGGKKAAQAEKDAAEALAQLRRSRAERGRAQVAELIAQLRKLWHDEALRPRLFRDGEAEVFTRDDVQKNEKGFHGTVETQDVRFPLLDGLLARLGELAGKEAPK